MPNPFYIPLDTDILPIVSGNSNIGSPALAFNVISANSLKATTIFQGSNQVLTTGIGLGSIVTSVSNGIITVSGTSLANGVISGTSTALTVLNVPLITGTNIVLISGGSIVPTISGINTIGTQSKPFGTVYAQTGYFHAVSGLSPISVLSDLIPSPSGVMSLGNLSLPWQNVITTKLNGLGANQIFGEIPSGLVNGINTSFTLANSPSAGTVRLFLAGLRISPSSYSVSGNTITFSVAPTTGLLLADYNWG